jgi:hypothetical protein
MMRQTGASPEAWQVPELGPSLGRLGDPALETGSGPLGAALDDIRLRLVTGLFELAGVARAFALAGDPDGAVATLNRAAWLALWEKAVTASAERVGATINARFKEAGAESRYPGGRLRGELITPDDTRAIGARLGAGGGPFVAALDELEQAARGATAQRAGERSVAWRASLTAAARRLEAAWLALEEAAAAEQRRWQLEVERVRAWHLPRWPLWLLTAGILAGAAYLGLVLGGYVPVPPILAGFAEFWWTRL